MLLLLLLPSVLALKQGGPIVDTVDPGDPIEYCVDHHCYKPLTWIDNKEQVCRSKKEKKCTPKSETVLDNILITYLETIPLDHGAGVHGGARDRVQGGRLHRVRLDQDPKAGQGRQGSSSFLASSLVAYQYI